MANPAREARLMTDESNTYLKVGRMKPNQSN